MTKKRKPSARSAATNSSLRLDFCTHEAALYAVQHYHYTKRLSSGRTVKIGVWEGGKFIGCVIFGDSTSPQIGKALDLTQHQITELTRVALARHEAPVTRILAIAIRMVRRRCPGLRAIISFADSERGHHGGIYQGGNWIYAGQSTVTQYWVRGRWRNDTTTMRLVAGRSDIRKRESFPKFRYYYPLDDGIRARLEELRQPFPRVRSADGGTTALQAVSGGSIPTRTLDG